MMGIKTTATEPKVTVVDRTISYCNTMSLDVAETRNYVVCCQRCAKHKL